MVFLISELTAKTYFQDILSVKFSCNKNHVHGCGGKEKKMFTEKTTEI